MALVLGGGSCGVLLLFHATVRPDLRPYGGFIPVQALGGVALAGVVFSIVNALCEEVIFRGILYDGIESQWGGKVAVVATAGLFGYGHLHGYPPGVAGAALAGLFGLGLSWLRGFTGGLGLGVLAHIVADATIFWILSGS